VAGTCGVGDNYLDVCIAVTGNEAEDVEEFRTGILEVLDGTVPEFTKEYTCHSLSLRRWFSCKANRFDIAGSTYTVISHTDITVRKQAENELRESNEKLRHLAQQQTTIFDASPVGIAIVVDRKIVSENRMFCQMMGYSPEEVLSKSTRLFYPSEDAFEKFGRASYPCFVEGRIYNTETDFRRKDGSIFTANITGGAIDPHDLSIGSIWIFEDITEMKSVTEQLVQSQKIESVGQLAGGLAHDFNNILSIISGYAYLMKLTMGADDKQHENLEKILTATSRAAELTHSLLAYSRKQVMNPQPQNLNTLVSNVGAFIRRLIGENIELAITMKDDPLSVDVDTVQMEQVMLNLATNARDAMPNGGVFGITTAAGSVDIDNKSNISHGSGGVCHYAVITVTDTGCGIAEHQVSCIFDPFFTTKESGKGTGLGLSMVIGIIRQHGGFVDVRSEIGVGTTFSIYLPLVASDDVGQETEASAHQLVSGTGTVLVAEDDPGVRVFMEELLTAAGYTVIPAIDGQDAVEKYSAMKDEIDLVIMDMVMPRKSGKTVCDEIRQMNSNAKVIVVSGYASDVLEQQGDLAADVMLIMKPLHPQKFMSMIAEILKK
jgi:PAS domain S-box-containing protein